MRSRAEKADRRGSGSLDPLADEFPQHLDKPWFVAYRVSPHHGHSQVLAGVLAQKILQMNEVAFLWQVERSSLECCQCFV